MPTAPFLRDVGHIFWNAQQCTTCMYSKHVTQFAPTSTVQITAYLLLNHYLREILTKVEYKSKPRSQLYAMLLCLLLLKTNCTLVRRMEQFSVWFRFGDFPFPQYATAGKTSTEYRVIMYAIRDKSRIIIVNFERPRGRSWEQNGKIKRCFVRRKKLLLRSSWYVHSGRFITVLTHFQVVDLVVFTQKRKP